jgi:hypothetical protein
VCRFHDNATNKRRKTHTTASAFSNKQCKKGNLEMNLMICNTDADFFQKDTFADGYMKYMHALSCLRAYVKRFFFYKEKKEGETAASFYPRCLIKMLLRH